MNALIVYGTRGGATKQIADEMSKVPGGQGNAVTVMDAGDTRDVDASAFDLIIVGSSVWMGTWKKEAVIFVKKNAGVLSSKKVALFSSGIAGDDTTKLDEANKCRMKKGFEKKGIDTSKPVDHRDWDAIRKWTADVAAKAKA